MITILIQIDEEKNLGIVNYESTRAETACFINNQQVETILVALREVVRDAEVI